jgi:[histone H3]-lysine9 N-trimethyltransferase SUV39H
MPLLVIFTRMDVASDHELTFSYTGDTDDEDEEEDGNSVSFCIWNIRTEADSVDTQDRSGAVYTACRCGAPRCTGKLFQ